MRRFLASVVVASATVVACFYDVPALVGDGGPNGPGDGTSYTESGAPCTCVPTPPAGWTLISYIQDSRPNCPSNWGTPVDGVSDPTAPPAMCTCTCNPTPSGTPTCNAGAAFSVTMGNSMCAGGSIDSISLPTTNCTNVMMTFTGAVTNLSAGTNNKVSGACGAPTTTEMIPPYAQKVDRACMLEGASGACGTGTVCPPTPADGYQLCISKVSTQNEPSDACPSGWPNRHISGAQVQDGRRCGGLIGPCTCLYDGTCSSTLSLYGQQNCNASVASVIADNTCQPTQMTGQTITRSAKYSATVVGGSMCKPDPSYKEYGGLSIKKPATTICCR